MLISTAESIFILEALQLFSICFDRVEYLDGYCASVFLLRTINDTAATFTDALKDGIRRKRRS